MSEKTVATQITEKPLFNSRTKESKKNVKISLWRENVIPTTFNNASNTETNITINKSLTL